MTPEPGSVGALDWTPENTVSRIADAGMKAILAEAEALGIDVGDALILLTVDGVPEGEPDAVTHPHLRSDEEPDGVSVLAFACSHARSLARAVGIPLTMTISGEDVP